MLRWDVINWLIRKYGYEDYLELGSTGRADNQKHNFNRILALNKTGVDTKGSPDYKMTTDEFFVQLDADTKYDIIFIDAEHIAKTVMRDISNSLEHLKDGGTIVVHDCNPPSEAHSVNKEVNAPYKVGEDGVGYYVWSGTVYQGFIHIHLSRDDLQCRCVDADWGCGIIQRGLRLSVADDLEEPETFDEFAARREEYLNLITVEEFKELYAS